MPKVLTKNELIESAAEELKLPDKTTKAVFNHLVGKIIESLAVYGEITLSGFGSPITVKQKQKHQELDKEQKLSTIPKTPKPAIEQRKLQRRNFILDIEVMDRIKDIVLGDLGDITTEGLMLVTDDPVVENELFKMKIRLPDETDEKLEFFFDALSVRCQKTIHEKIYITGFKIQDLDDENKQKIEYFINEYAV